MLLEGHTETTSKQNHFYYLLVSIGSSLRSEPLDQRNIQETMSESTQLHLLRPGQKGTITKINGTGALRRRFVEMGIVRGETILLKRHAPLGDPVEYFIKGYHLALRKEEAAQIEVSLLGDNHG
jgi:ferrous iron transport protein A